MPFRLVTWSRHAEVQLEERTGLSKEQVEAILQTPHQRFPDDKAPAMWVAQGIVPIDGKPYLVRVFYRTVNNDIVHVVSWYRTSQIRRYWRSEP